MMGGVNGSSALSVPPGFRFHPTDEELLYYYLKKKVSYEPIDFDVIREVDLNKLEPWDLKEKCRIGSGPQNEWYFFSHKDKKYPTGTRTNRATAAGFWKATGRDKAIHMSNSRRIGMRKTLVFYTGRAPHGHKTDWIMHEYRLDDDNNNNNNALPLPPREIQEDGWVICRVFKKKNLSRGFHADVEQLEETTMVPPFHAVGVGGCTLPPEPNNPKHYSSNVSFDSMHLPQLLSPESTSFLSMDPHNLLRLTSGGGGAGPSFVHHQDKISGDWSFLDKLLATHQSMDQITKFTHVGDLAAAAPGMQRFAFPYHGGLEHDFSKFPK